jgi:hypothetical protein
MNFHSYCRADLWSVLFILAKRAASVNKPEQLFFEVIWENLSAFSVNLRSFGVKLRL